MPEQTGEQLFIVDNKHADNSVMQLLQDWTQSSHCLDIATGYFDLGVFLAMEGRWQPLDKIRVLIGEETTSDSILHDALELEQRISDSIHQSILNEKLRRPLLQSATELCRALEEGKIEIRAYEKGKFHAKALITKPHGDTVLTQSLVGSSNFTKPGLMNNLELNVKINRNEEVSQLVQWFEKHWKEAQPLEEITIKLINKHTREISPFEVYAKSLQSLFLSFEPPAESEWEENDSLIFPMLDHYQKEAYWALLRIAKMHQGAFLCDGVGLGKTYVGLMLIEHFVSFGRKNVAVFAPKTTKDSVWIPHLKDHLPDLGGTSGMADLSNLVVFSHTDFSKRSKGFPEVFEQVEKNVDIIIVDEAHHFRNPGTPGRSSGKRPSRYHLLYDLLDKSRRPKLLFLLTATPICNSLNDFRHMTELITRRVPSYFSKSLGIGNLNRHLNNMGQLFREQYQQITEAEMMKDSKEILSSDKFISKLVVQRSRAYAKQSQLRSHGGVAIFPNRDDPVVAEYSIKQSYGGLLDDFKSAFDKENPLFALPLYAPLRWYIGKDQEIIDYRQINSQKQVVGLIRTMFIKRFESSIQAFEISCITLLTKMLAFIKSHEGHTKQINGVDEWQSKHKGLLDYISSKHKEYGKEELFEDEELVLDELVESSVKLDPTLYDLDAMMEVAWTDIEQLALFLQHTSSYDDSHDNKAQTLVQLIKGELANNKVLVFSEFAHTARYLSNLLQQNDIQGVAQFDGSSKIDRKAIVKRFSPFYNGVTPRELQQSGEEEIRILISTDVLSEGLNLQDATRLINYDIHWSPVRLMQRIGRVDRRMDPKIEELIKKEIGSKVAKSRGRVKFWNFLPPEELKDILSLYKKVTEKTLLISKTFGIEGRKLFSEDDDYEALKEFNEAYEGYAHTKLEEIHIEYQKLLQEHPDLESVLRQLPISAFSGKKISDTGQAGLFFCYSMPVYNESKERFEFGGETHWYLYDFESNLIVNEPIEIFNLIKCQPDTLRVSRMNEDELQSKRALVEDHMESNYLQQVNAPLDTKPELICWLELAK